MIASSIKAWKGKGTRWHAVYPKPHSAYALMHGVSIGQISSWVKRGKEIDQLPPLESPAAMREWVSRHYGTKWIQRYRRPHSAYAAIYKVDSRTIKRWVRKGKLISELPPLDNIPATQRWLARHMKQHHPARYPSDRIRPENAPWLIPPDKY
jgi:hypothetical protein